MSEKVRQPEVTLSEEEVPADGESEVRVTVEFSEPSGELETFTLNRGSFHKQKTERELEVTPDAHGNYVFTLYAPDHPGVVRISHEGAEIAALEAKASLLQTVMYEWMPVIVLALILQYPLRAFVVAAYFIPSGSMKPTLQVDDKLLAYKFPYQVMGQDPQFGNVIIFKPPGHEKDFIKRVIGLPGDTIRIERGVGVYRNGELIEEGYIKSPPDYNWGPEEVPEGMYFVLGDNRANSQDSHAWGFLPRENIEGRAMVVYWPPQRMGKIPGPGDGRAYAQPSN